MRVLESMIADNTQPEVRDRNVLGGPLITCSTEPLTGFYRNGCCSTGPEDAGNHTVCCVMTEAFLAFSVSQGNDLVTPREEWGFPGLKAGDRWCLCAIRWVEALLADCAPKVVLAATHERALRLIELEDLRAHAVEIE
jgi:hypothetical protein